MRFDGGRVCLDLAATGARASDARLEDADALTRWLRAAGLVPASTDVAVHGGWVPHFAALCALLQRLVECQVDGTVPTASDVAALNGFARPAPPVPVARSTGTNLLGKELATPLTCAALLSLVARDAVELLTDPVVRDRLRRCEGERCDRVYVDTSRGRRRRWCSSEACGNRERVARYRRRAGLSP